MRIALAQYDLVIGDVQGNASQVKEGIREARKEGAELVVFPELTVSGYPPQDLLDFEPFIQRCLDAVKEIAAECTDIGAIVGAPSFCEETDNRKRYNSAFFLAEGAIQYVQHKSLLPTYDVFDEERHFEAANERSVIPFKGEKIALTICEDLWDLHEELSYRTHPMEELAEQGATIMINIAASPYDHDHPRLRKDLMGKNAHKYGLPLFYVANVGAQTDLIFDGGSMVFDGKGTLKSALPHFERGLSTVSSEDGNAHPPPELPLKAERTRKALVMGLQDFFGKLGMDKAIIGLSGGIDSALTCALTAEALGPEKVYAIMMPSEFSSDHSIEDSRELVEKLGCKADAFPIRDLYDQYLETLAPRFEGTDFGLAEENLQARSRGVLLMALSNKFGHLLLNTTNKSELAVGYGTLYGDLCGALSVIGDLYKTEAYELAEHLNAQKDRIPRSIIEKAPSAELRPDQKDTDSLPPYKELDAILYRYIEERKGLDRIVEEGCDRETSLKVIKTVDSSEFKRYQSPPVLRISKKAFGIGRRMPLVRSFEEPR